VQKRIIEIIVDQLKASKSIPLQLPHPSDSRAMRIVDALVAEPAEQKTLERLCEDCGASKRTIERLFVAETKMTFSKWRQQLRLLHAMQLLASARRLPEPLLKPAIAAPARSYQCFGNSSAQRRLDFSKAETDR